MEYKVVGVIGDALVKERIAACYASKKGAGSGLWGGRTRKSALWSGQAADAWLTLGKPQQSKQRLDETKAKYASLACQDSISHFTAASEFLQALQREIQLALYPESGIEGPGAVDDLIDTSVAEGSEAFDSRPHRRSLMGAIAPPLASLGSAPLRGTLLEGDDDGPRLDQFE